MLLTELKIGKDAFAFPTVDGSAGQTLQTNGTGVLTWTDISGDVYWSRSSGGILSPVTSGDDLDLGIGSLAVADITLENDAILANKKNTNVDSGTNVIDSFSDLLGEGCVWHFLAKKGTNRRVGTVMATWNSSTNDVEYAEVNTKDLGTVDLTFQVNIISENVRLLATATSDDWEVRVIRQLI